MKLKPLSDLLELFYPDCCIHCKHLLLEGENILCVLCLHNLPIIPITDYSNNSITQIFYGRIPVELGFSLLYFRKKGITKSIIHELKYKGNEIIGSWLGTWIGDRLKTESKFLEADYIIPVPLHKKKLRVRGFNQVDRFAQELSAALQTPLVKNHLLRISATKTQTFKARFERFYNVKTKFEVRQPTKFENKHLLLVDDVLTTGATLEACAKEFLKIKGCKVSFITMAYTE